MGSVAGGCAGDSGGVIESAERTRDGPPLVLLHGSVHDSRLWNRVFAALAQHHTVRYDARGHGRSTPPTAPFRYEDDLLAVLDRFGIQTAGLIGLSMGGEVALDFTLEHPERVRSLTLIAASAGGHEWPQSPELDAAGPCDLPGRPHCRAGDRLVTTGPRSILRLGRHWPWTDTITSAFTRLQALPNPD